MDTVPETFAALPAMFPITCAPGNASDDKVVRVLLIVAVIFEAVPVVFWLSIGTSAATIEDRVADVPSERRYLPAV